MFSRFFISFFFMNPHFSLPICPYISPEKHNAMLPSILEHHLSRFAEKSRNSYIMPEFLQQTGIGK